MIRNLIGPKYLEKIRSSDYKSSVFAFAEIIDNSIDAGAQNIEIISTTKNKKWDKIYFIDDGAGMTKNILEKCVIFSETTNTAGSKKTGSFGFGLPNSSLSQCKEFSAISKIKNEWFENRINTTKMLAENSLMSIVPVNVAHVLDVALAHVAVVVVIVERKVPVIKLKLL